MTSPKTANSTLIERTAWSLSAIVLFVYALLPTMNYYWDGVSFAQTIESARAQGWTNLFHPNHLLYNVIGFGAYEALGERFRALHVLQALNIAVSALAAQLIFRTVLPFVGSIRNSLVLALCFSFAGTWWRFSTDGDAYILAVLLLVLCFRALVRTERPSPLHIAFWHTAAMVVHELAIVFCPVALLGLWLAYKTAPRGTRLRALGTYCAATAMLTTLVYAGAFHALRGQWSWRSMLAWVGSHSTDSAFTFTALSNLRISAVSWLQLLFIGRPALVDFRAPVNIALALLALAILGALVASLWRKRDATISRQQWAHPHLFALAMTWVCAYAVFLFFWLPHNTFYKLFALPGLIYLLASRGPSGDTRRVSPALWFVALMAITNLLFGILPYSKPTANAAVAFALELHPSLAPKAVVYFQDYGTNTDNWLARYFNPQTTWRPMESTAAVERTLETGVEVWLETTALDRLNTTDPQWLRAHTAPERRALADGRHRIIFQRLVRSDALPRTAH